MTFDGLFGLQASVFLFGSSWAQDFDDLNGL